MYFYLGCQWLGAKGHSVIRLGIIYCHSALGQ